MALRIVVEEAKLSHVKKADLYSLLHGLYDAGNAVPTETIRQISQASTLGNGGPLSNLANLGAQAVTGALPEKTHATVLPALQAVVNKTVVPAEIGVANAAGKAVTGLASGAKEIATGAKGLAGGVPAFFKALKTSPAVRYLLQRIWRR